MNIAVDQSGPESPSTDKINLTKATEPSPQIEHLQLQQICLPRGKGVREDSRSKEIRRNLEIELCRDGGENYPKTAFTNNQLRARDVCYFVKNPSHLCRKDH